MAAELSRLELEGVIGFGGKVPRGLCSIPGGTHFVFPLGSTLVMKDMKTGAQIFLTGHSNEVSCVSVSHDGKAIASGQLTHMGFKADVIVWDVDASLASGKGCIKHRLSLHKVKVQDVAFSHDSRYLATLGGRDDNNIVVWDAASGEPLCGSPASSETVNALTWYKNDSSRLATAGNYHVRIWHFDRTSRKLRPNDCRIGSIRRMFTSVASNADGTLIYCGSTSGDVLKFNAENGHFVNSSKSRFVQGVVSLQVFADPRSRNDMVVVGTGAGALALNVSPGRELIEEIKSITLPGAVTSISLEAGDSTTALVGTAAGTTHVVRLPSLEADLRGTAHSTPITNVCFPAASSEIFVTCGGDTVRVWNTSLRTEMLRVHVPNQECLCAEIAPAGNSILTGWTDGKIRAFAPESGRILFVINDAHTDAVTAVTHTHSGEVIASGGKDGRVRIWQLGSRKQVMLASLKEHKAAVTALHLRHDNRELVSASDDGSCIVWDMERMVRTNAVFASTMFKCAQYHPDGSQILSAGSDRRITYWDGAECTAIRILEGSEDEISALDIDKDGEFFVIGSKDGLVSMWHYDEGTRRALGEGHSGAVTSLKISSDKRRVISVGSEGAVFIWRFRA